MKFNNDQISLEELLVKTSYQTQTTSSTDEFLERPLSFGSGFIVRYQREQFFVTADHTLHLDDYKEGVDERTWNDYVVSIFNNYTPPGSFLSTVLTPLGGFYYMERFNLEKPDKAHELVDITLCKMKDINLQYPFFCDDVKFANQQKITIPTECFSKPKTNENHFIFGQIKTKLVDDVRLEREKTAKNCLKFHSQIGDYYLFHTPEIINDSKDWEGLSGSPVISENGDCVGVLCSVNAKSYSIWVMPIDKVKMLIELASSHEKLETS